MYTPLIDHPSMPAACCHVPYGFECPLEAEHLEYERRQALVQHLFAEPDSNNYARILEMEQLHGLFCPICQHGLGCEHGVPYARFSPLPHR